MKIIEVTDRQLMKRFADFVLELYKGCPYYVPNIYGDEINMLNPRFNLALKHCVARYYLCERDGKDVGRVGVIMQRKYNEISGKCSIRFTRFDCINDVEVARALLGKVEGFAREMGMDTIIGPYGFNETDRSGYLYEGFDVMANFGTNYNYPYYNDLLEQCGYQSTKEWLELQLRPNDNALEKFVRLSEFSQKKFGLRIAREKTFSAFAKNYGWKAFECLNAAYANLPGFVPFERDVYEQIRSQYSVALKVKYMTAIIDKNDDVAGFAVCFPSMAKAMQEIKGKLFPFGFIRVLLHTRKPKILELCLIGILPKYENTGANAILIANILQTIKRENIALTEAYPQLIDNEKTLSQWKHFNPQIVKRRRVVEKTLTPLS